MQLGDKVVSFWNNPERWFPHFIHWTLFRSPGHIESWMLLSIASIELIFIFSKLRNAILFNFRRQIEFWFHWNHFTLQAIQSQFWTLTGSMHLHFNLTKEKVFLINALLITPNSRPCKWPCLTECNIGARYGFCMLWFCSILFRMDSAAWSIFGQHTQ